MLNIGNNELWSIEWVTMGDKFNKSLISSNIGSYEHFHKPEYDRDNTLGN
jgi:hypothetical protein